MNLAMTVNVWHDEHIIFAQQLSATHILAQAALPDGSDGKWDRRVLSAMRNRVEKAGLAFAGLDSLPLPYNRAVLGIPGWEEEIPPILDFLRCAADAGVNSVCYRWITSAAAPKRRTPIGRGNAFVRSESAALHRRSQNTGRDRLIKFLDAILPTAQKVGISLVYSPISSLTHTDILPLDFPTEIDDLKWLALHIAEPCHGIDFNPGVIFDLSKPGFNQTQLEEMMLELMEKTKILLVSAANRQIADDQKREAFLNEGIINYPRILHLLKHRKYQGIVRADRQPVLDGDTAWGHKAQAYAIGYLRAVCQAIG